MTDEIKNMGFYVSIRDYAFMPSSLKLIAGDWVTFENRSTESHKIVFNGKESPELLPSKDS